VIGIETDRGPWVQALLAAGYRVWAINPNLLQVACYRERHSVSGAKGDPLTRTRPPTGYGPTGTSYGRRRGQRPGRAGILPLGQHPDAAVYRSRPGLSQLLAARLPAEFGDDPTRCGSWAWLYQPKNRWQNAPGVLDAAEPVREGRVVVLEGLELALGVGVVGDAWAAVRLGHTEVAEQQGDRLGGHRGAQVGMHGELASLDLLGGDGVGQQLLDQRGGLPVATIQPTT